MKALILAGGRGSRLNKITEEKNKSLVELFCKPLIEHNLEHAFELGVKEIIIVVGYKKEEIIRYVGNAYRGINVKYVVQKEQRGLVNAIETARELIGDADFALMLADEILVDARINQMGKIFRDKDLFAVCGVTFERDKSSIGKTYSAMCSEKGRLFRLIEKPRFPINNIKGTGHCIFKNQILDYIERTPINANRGEKELVDLIQCAIDEGKNVSIFPLTDGYVNVNTPEDLEVAKEMMKKSNPKILIVHPQMSFFGGAELLIVELANWLTKKGIRNDILTASVSKEVRDLLEQTDVIIPNNKLEISSKGFKDAGDILEFIKIFRKELGNIKENYDVINFHNFPATWCLYPKKKASVWMLNEPPNLWSKPDAGILLKTLNKLRNYADGKIGRSMDVICVADEFNKERCLERYKKNPWIVYYGVNYDFFSRGNAERARKKFNLDKKFVIVQSGVLSENKNQIESIKAVEKIKDRIPNSILVLAGKGEEGYEKMLRSYVKNKKLEKNVLFTGNLARSDLRDLYKLADVGLFPVGKQGGWLAPFELLCSGNPIVVSNEMGASSIIKKNNLGQATGNYSEAIINVWKDKMYKSQAKKAVGFVKKSLSWSLFADKMIKAYKDAWKMHC